MAATTHDSILRDSFRYRILVVGKSGVGKTTLIKRLFNIDTLEVSHRNPGLCDIDEEIFPQQNKHFVLHESQIFEDGKIDTFTRVKDFIRNRAREPLIQNRLHAIWLCIQIPYVQGRLLDRGDEEFLKLSFGKVPIIIVLTQFDLLYSQISYRFKIAEELKDMDPTENRERLIMENVERDLEQYSVGPIYGIKERPEDLPLIWVSESPKYNYTLDKLLNVTLERAHTHVQESEWTVSASAKINDADAFVATCIKVGMRKYRYISLYSCPLTTSTEYRGGLTADTFVNLPVSSCISRIHEDVAAIWSFEDEDKILQKESFKDAVCALVQDLADPIPGGLGPGSDTIDNPQSSKAILDADTSDPLPPVVKSVQFSAIFGKLLAEKYSKTPVVLRCLMGYLVDITIVLEFLFWFKFAWKPQSPSLGQEDIDTALELYRGSALHVDIHQQVRSYVDNMSLIDHPGNPDDKAHLDIERLISSQRQVLINAVFSYSEKKPDQTTVDPTEEQDDRNNRIAEGVNPTPLKHKSKRSRIMGSIFGIFRKET